VCITSTSILASLCCTCFVIARQISQLSCRHSGQTPHRPRRTLRPTDRNNACLLRKPKDPLCLHQWQYSYCEHSTSMCPGFCCPHFEHTAGVHIGRSSSAILSSSIICPRSLTLTHTSSSTVTSTLGGRRYGHPACLWVVSPHNLHSLCFFLGHSCALCPCSLQW
jgi:hypothetical protein